MGRLLDLQRVGSTDLLRRLGGFDEHYRSWGGEDIDLGYRLHRAGARFVHSCPATAIHWPHSKHYERNTRSVMENYRHFTSRYQDEAVQLVGQVRLVDINDVLLNADDSSGLAPS